MDSSGPAIDAHLLRLIRSRTGVSDDEVRRVFQESPSFRSLCYDLRACSRALASWRASDSGTAGERVDEYDQLLDQLTEEVRLALARAAPSRATEGRTGPSP